MNRPSRPQDIDALFRTGTAIDKALRKGVRAAMRSHHRARCPIVVYRQGRVIRIPASRSRPFPIR